MTLVWLCHRLSQPDPNRRSEKGCTDETLHTYWCVPQNSANALQGQEHQCATASSAQVPGEWFASGGRNPPATCDGPYALKPTGTSFRVVPIMVGIRRPASSPVLFVANYVTVPSPPKLPPKTNCGLVHIRHFTDWPCWKWHAWQQWAIWIQKTERSYPMASRRGGVQ